MTGLALESRVWRGRPAPGLLQEECGGDKDPAACQCLSWECPPPHPTPQWEGVSKTGCQLTVRGRPAKSLPFFSSTSLACR